MKLRLLDEQTVEYVYHKYLVNDFPPREGKPLSVILELIKKGYYSCYGLYEDNTLQAYAFFCDNSHHTYSLLDYYCVLEEYRCLGIGSKLLSAIKEEFKSYQGVIAEVERISDAVDEEDYSLKKRRVEFYLRNGLIEKDLMTMLFGGGLNIFYMLIQSDASVDTLEVEINDIYDVMFTEGEYRKEVRLYRR